VPLPSRIDADEIGESALDNALPWDRIAGVPYRTDPGLQRTSIAGLALEERGRADRDPNYRWLVADLAADDILRKRVTVSLNLAERKAERDRIDSERLARENARRAAKQLPALKTIEELEKAEEPDTVLEQATEIMSDIVMGIRGSAAPARTVKRSD
jgi:carboxyl-terminal processing protease